VQWLGAMLVMLVLGLIFSALTLRMLRRR